MNTFSMERIETANDELPLNEIEVESSEDQTSSQPLVINDHVAHESFDDCGLHEGLISRVSQIGWTKPTPVQGLCRILQGLL